MDTANTPTEQLADSGTCPPWCVTDHESDGPDRHDSVGRSVDALQLLTSPDGDEESRAVSLLVARHLSHGDDWIYAGDGTDQLLELSASSWRRLIAEVGALLDEAQPAS